MTQISPQLVTMALEQCETTAFEKYAQTVFCAVLGPQFKPLGGHKDGGADGFIDSDIHEEVSKVTTFFQASKEIDSGNKIRKTIERLIEVGRQPKTLYYATSHQVRHIDRLQVSLSEKLDSNIRIYDAQFFVQHANYNGDVVAAFQTYLRPSIAFLAETFAPSFPSNNTLQDARVVSAFLGQELERRLGTTKTLQSVCDALILWALEGTDPDTEALMSEEEIVAKVENVIPTTKQFFNGEVRTRLRHLSSKSDGARRVNIYKKSGRYCLPFESRSILLEHTIQDEALKAAVSEGFRMRILEASNAAYGSNVINTISNALHRIIETVFKRQGFGASCHFLSDVDTMDSLLDNRSIVEISEDQLEQSGLNINEHRGILNVTKTVIRAVFYQPSEPERTYCAKLSRTYFILFIIRNTPEIINYFNTM